MKTFDEIRGNRLTEATAGDHEEAAMAHETAAKSVRQDLRAKKAHQRAAEHHYDAADHIEDGNHEKANSSHVKAKNAAATAKQYGNKHSANAYADTHAVKRVPSTVGEGFVSAAQRKAVWASKADGGKGHPDNKRKRKKEDVDEAWQTISRGPGYKIQRDSNTGQKRRVADVREQDSDAVKAFLAKGGKIKKLPPAKAQGYHGKDDPGKDMHGVMDRPDTKRMGTRKKVKSMEAVNVKDDLIIRSKKPASTLRRSSASRPAGVRDDVNEISKGMAGRYLKKVPASAADAGRKSAGTTGIGPDDQKKNVEKGIRKFVNRQRGTSMAVDKMTGKAKVPAKEAKETDPPFDDAKKISTTPSKDQFGNIIKNRAKHLARQAAKKAGGDMGDKQKKESQELAELSPELLTRYAKKAIPQQFKKNDAAKSPINRGTEKGAKLQKTADKRKKGIDSVRKRSSPNDVGQHKTGKASRPHGGMRPGKGTSYKQKPAGGFNSKYLDQ